MSSFMIKIKVFVANTALKKKGNKQNFVNLTQTNQDSLAILLCCQAPETK